MPQEDVRIKKMKKSNKNSIRKKKENRMEKELLLLLDKMSDLIIELLILEYQLTKL
jgi:hypothetical protein